MLGLPALARAAGGAEAQFAPPEAWLPGEKLPYFGSENPWNRRFFVQAPYRYGQAEYLMLTEGRVDEAITACERRLAIDGANGDVLYVLALARGQQGRVDEADHLLERALVSGFPESRLLVDRSPANQRLHETRTWRRVATASSGLLHGPMLGAAGPRQMSFWVRTLVESAVEVRVSTKGDFARPDASGAGRTTAGADFTGVIAVDGLQPDTAYRYELWIDGRPVPRGESWSFRTFPADDAGVLVRLAFGGCAMYHPPHEFIWDTIRLRRPAAFLTLGDNVYVDLPETPGPLHDFTYHQRQSRPEFQRLTAGVPVFAIWDDHDAGIDDLFLGPYPDKPAWKVGHLELFRRNTNNPGYGAPPERPGVWHKFRVGPVECFMLDGRYYRENFLGTRPSMLGPAQKAWLFQSLKDSTAPFKLLVSPVAWADDAKIQREADGTLVGAKDIWSGYREERQEIYDFLADHRIEGVLLISSDRHRNDVRINSRRRGYPLLELESGWLTNEFGTGGSGRPIWEHLVEPAFGCLTFESAGPEPCVIVEFINGRGEQVFRREVKLTEMRAP